MAQARCRDAKGRFTKKAPVPPLDPETLRLAGEGLPPAVQLWRRQDWRLQIFSKERYTTADDGSRDAS